MWDRWNNHADTLTAAAELPLSAIAELIQEASASAGCAAGERSSVRRYQLPMASDDRHTAAPLAHVGPLCQ